MTRAATVSSQTLARRIAQGHGEEPADVVIKGAKLLDLITGGLVDSDIALCGDTIVGTHGRYEGKRIIDASGLVAVPGFIDTHLHIESSLVTPLEFERCVLPHGVTTAICDPHEIANVLGSDAFRYFLACAEAMRMDLRINLSSCVPATHLETAGARLEAADLVPFMDHAKVIGLAEFMNFPGVIHRDPACLDKLEAFSHRHIDGHAPLVRGMDLNAYLAAGIRTDHETTTAEEAREKLAKGMTVLIREGSVSKDLEALIPLISRDASPFLAFCTDDRNPLDIGEEGHLDYMIRTAIARGADMLATYRIASHSAARNFGLFDRGFIGPGKRADIVLVEDLAACSVKQVIAGGRLVEEALFTDRTAVAAVGHGSVKCRPVTPEAFRVKARDGETPVIGVVPGRIITERLAMALPSRDGDALPDLGQDAIKVSVIERHGKSDGPAAGMATGFVHGFGMKRGAIASSVGHDSHNLCVVGVDDVAMAAAVNRLIAIGGGFAVADGERVVAELALPVAGLMSEQPFETVRHDLETLRAAAKALGVVLAEPFLQVAFLTLPVIPHLKITDKGLVDVDAFELV
ncbi:adenine deaminase [Bosea sp. (in: a-proteobacteria)]|uniref:adenine deaminase n=1 Tax=Bosea sp. (in: a-proteobacteria) TaxID=1871050 RepID=UPI00122A7DC1|nr:adenine deaminase [Bosea sp. (in: a-proteobacteria)]TAJ30215.1 MAG: adenine deaminase [Bosea sp. (in: a-proteobacteria)]